MAMNSKRGNEARAYCQLQAELARMKKAVDAFLKSSITATKTAADLLIARARAIWKHEQHHDINGWVRPLERIDRMFDLGVHIFELGRTYPRTGKVDKELFEVDREYSILCEELGVLEPIGNPDQYHIREIARAVEAGAPPTPDGRPGDWPGDRSWIRKPIPWDPHFYVTHVIERYLTGETMLAGLPESELRICALAVPLVLDQDESVFQEILNLAEVENDAIAVSGKTEALSDLRWEGCSPIRWWILSRHFLRNTEPGVEADEWALRSKWDLDEAIKVLGNTVLDLTTTRTEWDAWIPAAIEILEAEPMIVSHVQRKLQPHGFPTTQKARDKLSAVLRGVKPWPARARTVVLATGESKRLIPVEGWRARVAEVLGEHPLDGKPRSSSPF